MTTPIPLNLAFEDLLLESIATRILKRRPNQYATRTIYNSGGNQYLRRTINGFNNAAKGTPFLVLTDLDRFECPQALIDDWLNAPKHANLLLRVAVREAEAWLLADAANFAGFLGIRLELVPENIEAIEDPKQTLINLARRSPRRNIREDLCPRPNSTSRVGPNYNGRLASFVSSNWRPELARAKSESLDRAIMRLEQFVPHWPQADANHV